jgi:hypothetical protein
MGFLDGLLDGKKKEEMLGSVNNKAETLKNEMIKAIRENMKEAEKAEMDEEGAEEDEYAYTDDLISSLKDDIDNDNIEMCQVLSAVIEEQGDIETEELVVLGRTILHKIQGGRRGGECARRLSILDEGF